MDALRERLRKTARAVASIASRPRVMLLESLDPLTLGLPAAASSSSPLSSRERLRAFNEACAQIRVSLPIDLISLM